MKLINYLENLDFESLISTTFLLPFFTIIIIIKILSVILYSSVMEHDEKEIPRVTVFSNWFGYFIFSFSMLIIYDYFDRKEKLDFRFTHTIVTDNQNRKSSVTDKSENNEGLEEINGDSKNSSTFSRNDLVMSENIEEGEEYQYIPSENELLSLEKDQHYLSIFKQLCSEAKKTKNLEEIPSSQICGNEEGNCKWCGNSFVQNKYLKPSYQAVADEIGIRFLFTGDGWNSPNIYKYVKDYEKGIKVQCVTAKKEFCSLKCEKEFKNDRGY